MNNAPTKIGGYLVQMTIGVPGAAPSWYVELHSPVDESGKGIKVPVDEIHHSTVRNRMSPTGKIPKSTFRFRYLGWFYTGYQLGYNNTIAHCRIARNPSRQRWPRASQTVLEEWNAPLLEGGA